MVPRKIGLMRAGDSGLLRFWRGQLVCRDDLFGRGIDRLELHSSALVHPIGCREDGDFYPLLVNLGFDGRQRLNVCTTVFPFVRITAAPPAVVVSGADLVPLVMYVILSLAIASCPARSAPRLIRSADLIASPKSEHYQIRSGERSSASAVTIPI
jgi:hypothetical protein